MWGFRGPENSRSFGDWYKVVNVLFCLNKYIRKAPQTLPCISSSFQKNRTFLSQMTGKDTQCYRIFLKKSFKRNKFDFTNFLILLLTGENFIKDGPWLVLDAPWTKTWFFWWLDREVLKAHLTWLHRDRVTVGIEADVWEGKEKSDLVLFLWRRSNALSVHHKFYW